MRSVNITSEPKLHEAGVDVYEGWNAKLANDLVRVSKQLHIMQNTPNDATKRFMNVDKANDWYDKKDRSVYSLYCGGSLDGIAWFGLNERPDLHAGHTFAIRLYENAVGRGLAYLLMKIVHDDFAAPGGIWLETDDNNSAARRLYEKFGYQKVNESDGRVTMVYK